MQSCDMICNINNLPAVDVPEGVALKRAFVGDKGAVLGFMREHFSEGWACEAEKAILSPDVGKCFAAVRDGKLIGVACFDSTARGYFGPIGVLESERGTGVGKALLLRALHAMHEYGYGWAIIGWVDSAATFYRKVVGAEFIPGGEPSKTVYQNMLRKFD